MAAHAQTVDLLDGALLVLALHLLISVAVDSVLDVCACVLVGGVRADGGEEPDRIQSSTPTSAPAVTLRDRTQSEQSLTGQELSEPYCKECRVMGALVGV